MPTRETIFEYQIVGNFGRVNAIDVATGIEVSVSVPAGCAKVYREQLALRRLDRELASNSHIKK
ncbi:MAG: serine hydroxymethyltransferase [Hyphomonadaceae bacterium]|nr:serine hydroxymethyltransferase [Hyphomonadaceae bacterium]